MSSPATERGPLLWLLLCPLLAQACERDMIDQPRYEAYSPSSRWSDGTSARPLPEGVVSRTSAALDDAPDLATRDTLPFALTPDGFARGRDRFMIYCSPCHGALGDGMGMVVQRGFQRPPSFYEARLRAAPYGHFYQVITQGFGAMYEYGSDVPPHDRWLIAAYVRALQQTQPTAAQTIPPPSAGTGGP